MMEFAIQEKMGASSGRKNLFRGTYKGRPAVAAVFESRHPREFAVESASLLLANRMGAGPKLLSIDQSGASLVIVEEDAGIPLRKALMGDVAAGIPPLGKKDRTKVKLDVMCQAKNLHDQGVFHQDLRLDNVCVRRFGAGDGEVKATLIDFELAAGFDAKPPAHRDPYLYRLFFGGSDAFRPLALDLAYLSALLFEIDYPGLSVFDGGETFEEYVNSESNRFFSFGKGEHMHVRMIDRFDIAPLATDLGLFPVEKYQEKYGRKAAQYADAKIRRCGFFDREDRELIEEDVEFRLYRISRDLAIASHERRRGHADFKEFDDQKLYEKESGLRKAEDMIRKVRFIGYDLVPSGTMKDGWEAVEELNPGEIEWLARCEHCRWCEERTQAGWTYADIPSKNEDAKQHPDLLPFDRIRKESQEYNRNSARHLIGDLRESGFFVCKRSG